jgi:hypothetical protein
MEMEFSCMNLYTGKDCTGIPAEEQLICTCLDCVRELIFTYTGEACSPGVTNEITCTDYSENPLTAAITISDGNVALFEGLVSIGDKIILEDASCLPATLTAEITSESRITTQTVVIDTSCDTGGKGLVLSESYGAFKFVGYSCDEEDTHNCLVDVIYQLEACNVGGRDEELYDFFVDVDGEVSDLIANISESDLIILPTDCYTGSKTEVVDRCTDKEYCAKGVSNATKPIVGPTCEEMEEIKFSIEVPTLPPFTPPTPFPTSPSSSFPSSAPSPAPTQGCIINIDVDGCFNYTSPFDNNCEGRPWVITFRYNGGDCSQSDNLQDRQKFDCFDIEPSGGGSGPPPTDSGSESYIVATSLDKNSVYFEGFVPVGESYTLNKNGGYDKLSADMNITVYDPKGSTDPSTIVQAGNIAQTMYVHLSCSQPLFLLDRFGAHQVVEWIETDGRVVSTTIPTVTQPLEVSLNSTGIDGQSLIRLLEMNIISNTEGFINMTDEVNGMILEAGTVLPLPPINITVDLSQRTRYTFFTTIVGETIDGSTECNGFDFHECIVGQPLPPAFPTMAPSPSPTVTPFPTPDPLTTRCVAESSIECMVSNPFGTICDNLSAPNATTCSNGARIAKLQFRVTSNKCGDTEFCEDYSDETIPDQVYIEIVDCEKSGFFQGTANQGDIITVNSRGNFLCDEISISISTFDFDEEEEENNGESLQYLELPSDCLSETGWELSNDYGALKLVQYESDIDGLQSTYAVVSMRYAIENSGPFAANIDSANVSSAFTGSQEFPTPILVGPRDEVVLSSETTTLNLTSGTTFDFSLSISGVSNSTGQQICSSDALYSFTV